MATALTVDDCDICAHALKNPRVLDCNHVFCLNCLEKLERRKTISCPICRVDTAIPPGMQVSILPKRLPSKVSKYTEELNLTLVKSWKLDTGICGIVIDEENSLIYVGQKKSGSTTAIYTFNGRLIDWIKDSGGCSMPGLTWDSKRNLLIYAWGTYLGGFDRNCTEIGAYKGKVFKHLGDVAYDRADDMYVVGDITAHVLYLFSPSTEQIVKTVPANEARRAKDNSRNFYIASSKLKTCSMFATLDNEECLVKLYDNEGRFIRSYGGPGAGVGKLNRPHGICFDYKNRILVSDLVNHRIVRISPDGVEASAEFEVILTTEQFGFGHPRHLEVTENGFLVVGFYSDPSKGSVTLAIFSGYK